MRTAAEGVCWVHKPWELWGGGSARITPEGILVQHRGQPAECWPWMDLDFQNGQWARRLDREGSPLPGNRIHTPPSRHAAPLQALAVRRLCRRPGWTMANRPNSGNTWQRATGMAACSVLSMAVSLGIAGLYLEVRPASTAGADAALILLDASLLLVCAGCAHSTLRALWALRLNNVTRLVLDNNGVHTTLKTGDTTELPWDGVSVGRAALGVPVLQAGRATVPLALLHRTMRAIVVSRALPTPTPTLNRRRQADTRLIALTAAGMTATMAAAALFARAIAPGSGVIPGMYMPLPFLAAMLVVRRHMQRRYRDLLRAVRRDRAALGPCFPAGAPEPRDPTLAPP